MKKIVFLLTMATCCTSLYAGNDGTDPGVLDNTSLSKTTGKAITDGGFFVHLTLGFPSLSYGYPVAFDNDDSDFKFGVGPGLQLGNLFKITDISNNAIGVKAVWLSSMYSSFKVDVNDTLTYNYGVIQASALRLGPYFTIALNSDMAVDVFYTAGMSVMIGVNDNFGESLGLTHNVGVSYRMSVLSVGLDFNFGNTNDFDKPATVSATDADYYKIRTTHLRFFVGVKI